MLQNIIGNIDKNTTSKQGYISSPNFSVSELERYIQNIFDSEKSSFRPVILDYNPIVIKKIVAYLTGKLKTPAAVAIAGETASGKSTITQDVVNTIQSFAVEFGIDNAVVQISTDDYYKDRSEEVKRLGSFAEFAKVYDVDIPDALDLDLLGEDVMRLISGKETYLPKYMMDGSAVRHEKYRLAKPAKIIITEGLFSHTQKIRNIFDFKIYIDVPKEVQKDRFYTRALERDLGESTDLMYKNANDKAEIYIRPCKKHADIVISGCAGMDKYKIFLNKIMSIVQELYFN